MPSSPPSPSDHLPLKEEIRIEIRESEVLRPAIQVLPTGVVRVTAPPGFPISPLLERHAAWIHRKREEIREISLGRAGQEGRILLGGRFLSLERGPFCGIRGEEGVVSYTTPKELKAFLRERLRGDLVPRLEAQAVRMRIRFTGLSIREQRGRWASCSPSGRISVNLRVLALPGALRDYLVVHELAHLLEPNHSRRYWKKVGELYPDYRHAEEELRRYWILLDGDGIWGVLRKV